jgi:hypothetical protein
MMRTAWNVLVLTLAMNFIAAAGGVVWLQQTGRLDRERLLAVKQVLFPDPEPPEVEAPPLELVESPTRRLEALLEWQAGEPAEQVQAMQHAFDAQMVQLDRRQREMADLQRQVELAQQQLARDRQVLERERQTLEQQQQETARLAADRGFQDSLDRYNVMPARQVKSIFMDLEDEAVMRYLQAMQPRSAARIMREFKSQDELRKIQAVLEMMRQSEEFAGANRE